MSASDPSPLVVYVDDEVSNLKVFEANFRSRFRILTCDSAEEALEVLAQRSPEIAVLISDQRMPGLTGVELLERARSLAPDVRRMLITAYSDMQAVIDAVNRGQVVRYFVKPWVKEDLGAALEDSVHIFRLRMQRRELEARMLRSERLAAIGQVSAGVAHELMNPVSYMTQNVTSLRHEFGVLLAHLDKGALAAEGQRAVEDLPSILDDVETGARHIREVALSIRQQARGDDQERVAQLKDVVAFATRIARAEVRLKARIQIHGEPVKVALGPVKLGQVLINLVVNSAHAMDEAKGPGLIEIRWWTEGDAVRLDVEDTGKGIPEELLGRVFEPLFTTKPAGVGTGLGLSIAKEIVETAGGKIHLRSEAGKGTTVELTLPLA